MMALVLSLVVVYCCFHRCRIPRTKQEIEADLMRSNMSTKFYNYLQEFPNEPVSFIEALKKVQELEEKIEKEESGTKKRMGWLRLKGKQTPEKEEPEQKGEAEQVAADETIAEANADPSTLGTGLEVKQPDRKSSDIGSLRPLVDSIMELKDKKPSEPNETINDTKAVSVTAKAAKRRRHNKPNLTRTKQTKHKSGSTLDLHLEATEASVDGKKEESKTPASSNHVVLSMEDTGATGSKSKSVKVDILEPDEKRSKRAPAESTGEKVEKRSRRSHAVKKEPKIREKSNDKGETLS